MSTHEPGTVAVATVRGVPNVCVFRFRDVYGKPIWDAAEPIQDRVTFRDDEVTAVRPLVVLDIDDPKRFYADLGAAIEATGNGAVSGRLRKVADQIEAQTKPPRIPEPGLWGVVKARFSKSGTEWHATKFPDDLWHVDDGGSFYWHEFIDPVLVRDGIEDGSR